jgi:S-adenosylmethionine hydrolase
VARPVVFFLSDYGLADEFVGVVHAVILRLAPDAAVVDLTHGIPAFDVRAGAECLARAVPHLGPGVVLGVVDPGVGSARRAVAVRAEDGRWFVAPDNGLVLAAVERSGGVDVVRAVRKPADASATFDGRDVLAPVAAALAGGADPASVGDEADPASLVRLVPENGGVRLRAPVTWVDRFGNVQLAVAEPDGPPPATELLAARIGGEERSVRRVRAFAELGTGELGMLTDANGRLALVVRQGSAARETGLGAGDVVELRW